MNIICTTLNAKFIHTNLAIRLLKAYAAPEFDVQMVEYTIKDPVLKIVTDLMQKKPTCIGFSCYIWNIEDTLKIIQMIKKIDPSIVIVLGGPEVSYDSYEWMTKYPEIDYIVMGEGEKPFKDLLFYLNGEGNESEIEGICYRKDGKVKVNPLINKVDLKTIPSPFRFPEDKENLSKRITYIETSRGCPFSCQFCLSSIEVGVRYFDREKVKEELRYLMANGAKNIKFIDRTFNISRSYALDMFQFLIDEHAPGTVFQFEITADIMRPEVIEFLNREAPPGLFRFEIGVQSTNDYTNELVMRKQNFEKLARTVTMIKEGGKIVQHLDLIAGLPEEDYNSFKKTFNDVFAFRPEEIQLGFLKMLRGTGLRNQAKEYDYVYMEHPPYEILGNRVMDFYDIIKIKQVEDVLDKYWNDHRMDFTVEYLVSKVFPTPFDFFQDFGSYWEDKGWSRIGHQLEDLFLRLYTFLETKEIAELPTVLGLMKLDYLQRSKYKPRKNWWPLSFEKEERSKIYQAIVNNPAILGEEFLQLKLNEKEIYKHTIIEDFSFNVKQFLHKGEIVHKNTASLIYFDPTKEQAFYFPLLMK